MSLVVCAFMGQYRKNSDLVSGCDLKVVLDRDECHPRFQCRQHLQFLPVLSTLPPYLHHVGRGPVSAARRGFPGRELKLQMGLIDLHDGRGRGKNWELYEETRLFLRHQMQMKRFGRHLSTSMGSFRPVHVISLNHIQYSYMEVITYASC